MESIKRVKRELRTKGSILEFYKDTVEVNGQLQEWDFMKAGGGAAIVAVNEEGKILMVRQYRNAIDDFSLELPAGKADDLKEPTIECAKRELEEETGYYAKQMDFLMSINSLIAFTNEKVDIYVAKDLVKTQQHLDPEEDIKVELWSIEDLQRLIFDGKLVDAKTIAGIMGYIAKYRA